MMIKLETIRRVMDFPVASKKQTIDERNSLVRNFERAVLLVLERAKLNSKTNRL